MNNDLYGVLNNFMKLLSLKSDENEQYYVNPGSIRSWIQAVFDKTLPNIKKEFPKFGILNVSEAGFS